jgi:hypothetical protein
VPPENLVVEVPTARRPTGRASAMGADTRAVLARLGIPAA